MEKIRVLNKEVFSDLHLYARKNSQIKEGEYKYLITSYGGTSHTAFHTKKGLNRYLKDTGLKIGKSTWNKQAHNLIGKEIEISLAGDKNSFNKFCKDKNLRESRVLSNGSYTKSCIKNKNGGNQIYFLNPNYDRKILKYKHE